MTVPDHPVHPRTKINDSFRYGCNNSERKPGYTTHVRHYYGNSFFMVEQYIEDVMSKVCHVPPGNPACEGCMKEKA